MEGHHVTLEPLRLDHAKELWPAAADPVMARLWPRRWTCLEDVEMQFRVLFAQRDRGASEPFLIRHHASGRAVGSSSYYNMSQPHRHLSIGWTFIIPEFQRTAVNTETKLLLLEEAFERRDQERVQFDVDARNTRSRAALARIGAVEEGVLRRHKILWDGFIRDTVVLSIVRDEWPDVKARLQGYLGT